MSNDSVTPASSPERRRRWRRGPLGWSRRTQIIAAILGAALAGTSAYAAANWAIGLASGSSGEAQSASVSNISIVPIASPAATNLLYPGGTGDVVARISNPNNFPVTITAVNLPTSTTYAGGYSDSTLATAQSGCTTTTSLVAWNFATGTSGSSHTLATPIVMGPLGLLTVTFTNDAIMGASSPAACETTYFMMPALTGATATAGGGTATVATTDSWTS